MTEQKAILVEDFIKMVDEVVDAYADKIGTLPALLSSDPEERDRIREIVEEAIETVEEAAMKVKMDGIFGYGPSEKTVNVWAVAPADVLDQHEAMRDMEPKKRH